MKEKQIYKKEMQSTLNTLMFLPFALSRSREIVLITTNANDVNSTGERERERDDTTAYEYDKHHQQQKNIKYLCPISIMFSVLCVCAAAAALWMSFLNKD